MNPDFKPPTSGLRPLTSVLRPLTSDLRPPTSVLRPLTSGTPVVVCAADDGYALPLAVMLRSLADNARSVEQVVVYVLDGGIRPENRKRVEQSLAGSKLCLNWICPEASALNGLPVFDYISICAYYRFLVPDILPRSIDCVIYLDIDLLVLGDIGELWRQKPGEYAVRAVPDASGPMIRLKNLKTFFRDVPEPETKGYFNSGVLVMNLDKWRENKLANRILEFIAKHKDSVLYWDQDGLNAVLYDDWAELPACWNIQSPCVYRGMRAKEFVAQAEQVSVDSGIYHFFCRIKPWQFGAFEQRLMTQYYHYIDQTAWAGWRPRPRMRDRLRHWGALLQNRYFYTGVVRRMLGVGGGK